MLGISLLVAAILALSNWKAGAIMVALALLLTMLPQMGKEREVAARSPAKVFEELEKQKAHQSARYHKATGVVDW